VGLDRSPLSLVSTTEDLLGRNSSGSGLEIRADHVAPFIRKKLALTSLTSNCRSVGIVRLQTEATVFFYYIITIRTLTNECLHTPNALTWMLAQGTHEYVSITATDNDYKDGVDLHFTYPLNNTFIKLIHIN
jgi:hypothetical protein